MSISSAPPPTQNNMNSQKLCSEQGFVHKPRPLHPGSVSHFLGLLKRPLLIRCYVARLSLASRNRSPTCNLVKKAVIKRKHNKIQLFSVSTAQRTACSFSVLKGKKMKGTKLTQNPLWLYHISSHFSADYDFNSAAP